MEYAEFSQRAEQRTDRNDEGEGRRCGTSGTGTRTGLVPEVAKKDMRRFGELGCHSETEEGEEGERKGEMEVEERNLKQSCSERRSGRR